MTKSLWYVRIYLIAKDENTALDRAIHMCGREAVKFALRWNSPL